MNLTSIRRLRISAVFLCVGVTSGMPSAVSADDATATFKFVRRLASRLHQLVLQNHLLGFEHEAIQRLVFDEPQVEVGECDVLTQCRIRPRSQVLVSRAA